MQINQNRCSTKPQTNSHMQNQNSTNQKVSIFYIKAVKDINLKSNNEKLIKT